MTSEGLCPSGGCAANAVVASATAPLPAVAAAPAVDSWKGRDPESPRRAVDTAPRSGAVTDDKGRFGRTGTDFRAKRPTEALWLQFMLEGASIKVARYAWQDGCTESVWIPLPHQILPVSNHGNP
jgi:hypothetical protein